MGDTYTQLYIQLVFAVKGRENLISPTWKTDLHKYIAGIIKGKGQKSIIVNGTDQVPFIFAWNVYCLPEVFPQL